MTKIINDDANEQEKVFYSPLGGTMGYPLDHFNKKASLESFRSVQDSIDYLTNWIVNADFIIEEKDYTRINKTISKLNSYKEAGLDKFLIWGYTPKGNSRPKKGDITFFGYKDCILYLGEVYDTFNSSELSQMYWGNAERWENKVVLKNLTRIYIPRSKYVYDSYPEFRESHSISISKKNVKRCYDTPYLTIFGIKTEGYLEGLTDFNKLGEYNTETILNNLDLYVRSINYENIGENVYEI